MSALVSAILAEYRRYKALADGAIAQMRDAELSRPGPGGANSLAIQVWHLSGNFTSRFTDFLTTDGEKPWRQRESEFEARTISRSELLAKWENGWRVLFGTVEKLTDADLPKTITIRGKPLEVQDALLRSLAHCGYHVGQMVYLARAFRGGEWQWQTIPPGGSTAYNQNPTMEKPDAHAGALRQQQQQSQQ
jgi:hypothetical protein